MGEALTSKFYSRRHHRIPVMASHLSGAEVGNRPALDGADYHVLLSQPQWGARQVDEALRGARVVGIAGGAAKCRHVVEDLGFDTCVDRKDPAWPALLDAARRRAGHHSRALADEVNTLMAIDFPLSPEQVHLQAAAGERASRDAH